MEAVRADAREEQQDEARQDCRIYSGYHYGTLELNEGEH